jgi:hypothetical protein
MMMESLSIIAQAFFMPYSMKEPIQYTKWSCAFKCKKAFLSRKKAIEHQQECLSNPENRSCKTCTYGGTDTVDEPYIGGGDICYNTKTYRTCDHPIPSIQDEMIDILDTLEKERELGWLPVHIHCTNWKVKDRKMAIGMILDNLDNDSLVSDPCD